MQVANFLRQLLISLNLAWKSRVDIILNKLLYYHIYNEWEIITTFLHGCDVGISVIIEACKFGKIRRVTKLQRYLRIIDKIPHLDSCF